MIRTRGLSVALISLEPWNDVWRRNQHLASQLVRRELVRTLIFVEPPLPFPRRAPTSCTEPEPGIRVVTPVLSLPKRAGGLRVLGRRLARTMLGDMDVIWVNDATLGVHCLSPRQPALYDVTDDWRDFGLPSRIRRRIVRAEDELAARAKTVVCSAVLRDRWRGRYGVIADVVHNGVDADAWLTAEPIALSGPRPHVGYIGTLHQDRLDIDLLSRLAGDARIGTVHLVGPDSLSDHAREVLRAQNKVVFHGPVEAREVPSWTKAMDVLVSPHSVTAFTMSLDAIKSYEYLASGRPVVATPTSGFQLLQSATLHISTPDEFVDTVAAAATQRECSQPSEIGPMSWAVRAEQFGRCLHSALGVRDDT